MGVNDEYSRDAHNCELAYDSDSSDDFDNELHPEDWQDMYSQELLDGWMEIRRYASAHYIGLRGGFHEFAELVLEPKRWYYTREPLRAWVDMWYLISDLPVISDRVQAENFYEWAENYIGYISND